MPKIHAMTLALLLAAGATTAGAQAALDPRVARADAARIQGDPSATLWVLIVSDFQCPYCKQWHDEVSAAFRREFVASRKVRLAYVNFPLQMHANALPASEAAMCAGAQDKFWPYHDALFANAGRWSGEAVPDRVFAELAAGAKLNMAAFTQCMTSHVMVPMIQADRQRGTQLGVRSTPTFVIGNTMIPGAAPLEVLRSAVNKALAK